MDWQVTPPKRVRSPTWGPPPPLTKGPKTSNFQKLPSYTFFGGNVCVPVHFGFSLPLIFTLVEAGISHFLRAAIKFSCFSSN